MTDVNRKMTQQEVREAWQQEWDSRQQQSSEAANEKDFEKAWQVLSGVAEATLTRGQGIMGQQSRMLYTCFVTRV